MIKFNSRFLFTLLLIPVNHAMLFATDVLELHFVDRKRESVAIDSLFNEEGVPSNHRLLNVKTLSLSSKLEQSEREHTLLELTNGDLIFTDQVITNDDAFEFKFLDQRLSIPIEFVHEVTWRTNLEKHQRSSLVSEEVDKLQLENGDFVSGEFISKDEDQLQIVSEIGLSKIPSSKLKRLILSEQLSETIDEPELAYECYFSNGSVVTFDSMTYLKHSAQFQFRQAQHLELDVSPAAITRIEIWSPRFRRIHQDHLQSESSEDFFGNVQSCNWNLNADGRCLLTSTMFSKYGFGVRSQSTLTFRIPIEATTLKGTIGLDSRVNHYGNVRARILLNDITLWEDQIDASKSPEINLVLDSLQSSESMSPHHNLKFIVDFGTAADIGDLVNWQQFYYILLN